MWKQYERVSSTNDSAREDLIFKDVVSTMLTIIYGAEKHKYTLSQQAKVGCVSIMTPFQLYIRISLNY